MCVVEDWLVVVLWVLDWMCVILKLVRNWLSCFGCVCVVGIVLLVCVFWKFWKLLINDFSMMLLIFFCMLLFVVFGGFVR